MWDGQENPWKYAYTAFCILLLCLAAVPLYLGMADPQSGWDYRVFKGAVQAVNHGENPYVLATIDQYTGDNLPFTYPPHTLFLFWILQFVLVFQSIQLYLSLPDPAPSCGSWLLLTVDQKPHYLFFVTLLGTGFISLFWNFITGNKDSLFFFLFAGIVYLLAREKFRESSIVTGLTGSISLITLPFSALFLVVRRPWTERLQLILLSLLVPAAIFLVTYLISPALFTAFLGTVGGARARSMIPRGITPPRHSGCFGDLLNRAGLGGTAPLVVVSLAYLGILGWAAWYCITKNQGNDLKLYALAILFLFMLLPRTKPYDFLILVVPVYFLFRESSYPLKMVLFGAISLLPLFVWYYPWIDASGSLPYLIDAYPQTISLFLLVLILLIREWYRDAPDNGSLE